MKIYGFFGACDKAGCSSAATAFTHFVSKTTGEKALLIYGSGKVTRGYAGRGELSSLDYIRPNILSRKLTEEDMRQIITECEGIGVIGDVNSYFTAKIFPLELYDVIKEALSGYSHVVIDGGCRFELAMCISAVNISDSIYVILNQEPSALRKYLNIREALLKPMGLKYNLLLNKYMGNLALYRKGEIEKLIGEDIKVSLPFSEYGLQAELEGTTLLNINKYKKGIENLYDLDIGKYSERKRLFTGRIFGFNR